jgi:hypothetical protein
VTGEGPEVVATGVAAGAEEFSKVRALLVDFSGAGGEFHDPAARECGVEMDAGFLPDGFGDGAWDDWGV